MVSSGFFATWCGPCRMELPELEQLYTKLKLKNFNLVGISADQSDVYTVQKFVAELKLTFPILHDLHGDASSAFHANALPTLYLISPDLKLVGIASGARSWSSEAIVNEFEKLTTIKSVEVKYFEELAEKLKVEPPVLEVEPLPEVFVNDSLLFKVKIHWKGEPAKYVVTVPKINFPNEITLNGNIGSSTSATSTEAVLNYIYPVLLNKVGTFQTGPIIMSFRSAAGGPEQFSRHPGVEIMVKSRSWNFVFALSIVVSLIIFMIFFIGKT
ncbi:MAG: TlpA disulfide reductase family protein [Bacteriovoracaceae bacterium]